MLDLATLLRLGLLPPPTTPRRATLWLGWNQDEVVVEVGPGGLASPSTGLPATPLARRPFARSPGRWHVECPTCRRWVRLLLKVSLDPADDAAHTTAPARPCRWGCRACLGRHSLAALLNAEERVWRAVERAAEIPTRRTGEKRQRWLRREAKAATANAEASRLVPAAQALLDRGLPC